ncbi:MAG: DUF349 domain-containing protein [Acetatifactor muris]|nr:DUF349 domain-containing protein [Acetatifactor muris]
MSKDGYTKTRDVVNNFGDPKAVVREWKDTAGDTVGIEVFYGGRNGGDSEGHGHFIAKKIDGLFQTTLDRHPDLEDGGRHAIEVLDTKDAYNNEARQDRIWKKKAIIDQISYIDYDDQHCIDKIKDLESEFYNVGSCGHDDNISLKQEFKNAKNDFFNKRREHLEQRFRLTWMQKESIISRAQNLLYSSDSNTSRDEMNRLLNEWKGLPRTTKVKDDELWERFNAIRTEFREKQMWEYERRKAQQQDAKIKKEYIVSRAESLMYATDFKSAKDEMKSLMEQWKMSPRASRQDEDSLWQRFSRAREALFDRAKQDYEKRQLEYSTAKARKESIISQAESLCSTSDFRSASDQMKNLSQQFYDAGNAGKDNQNLKDRFNNVKQRFYEAKRIAGEAQHREYLQKLQERLYEKQQKLSNLDDAIYRTQSSISELMSRPDPSYTNPHRYEIAARRNEKLSNLNEKLRSMGERRSQLIDQIYDLQSKINR